MMGIGLDLPKSFWKRLSNQNYEFSLVDLEEVDTYRYEMLKAIQHRSQNHDDEPYEIQEANFVALFGDYTFEADFGHGEPVKLCKDGETRALTIENADEYLKLYLSHYDVRLFWYKKSLLLLVGSLILTGLLDCGDPSVGKELDNNMFYCRLQMHRSTCQYISLPENHSGRAAWSWCGD